MLFRTLMITAGFITVFYLFSGVEYSQEQIHTAIPDINRRVSEPSISEPIEFEERGLRNNNPGNIVKTQIPWIGKVDPSQDPNFEQFKSMEYGLAAMLRVLWDYYHLYNRNDVLRIAKTYCPPGYDRWAKGVAEHCGWAPDQPFEWSKKNLQKLSRAIAIQENGHENIQVVEEAFEQAWAIFPHVREDKSL